MYALALVAMSTILEFHSLTWSVSPRIGQCIRHFDHPLSEGLDAERPLSVKKSRTQPQIRANAPQKQML
jgi:hypothetical protein